MKESVMVETRPSADRDVKVQLEKPPAFVNSMMTAMLRMPGVQRVVGQGVALLSFTGRRTGRHYTIPISYERNGDTVTLVTKKQRNWWHNFEAPAEVELRLAGRTHRGTAVAAVDDEEALEFLTEHLEKRPIDAKAFGVRDEDGKVVHEKVVALLPHIVLVRIDITPTE